MRGRALVAAGWLAGALVGWVGPVSAATGVVEVGWWTRSPVASAPEGGFAVGRAPDGAVSVAALRLDLGRGVSASRLLIEEAGGALQQLAAVRLCRGDEQWQPVAKGKLEEAPRAHCGTTPVVLQKQGGTWSADLGALVGGAVGQVTVMVVPGDGPAPVAAWEVRFQRPVLEATEASLPQDPARLDRPTSPPAERASTSPVTTGGVPLATPSPPAVSTVSAVAAPPPSAVPPQPAESAPLAPSSGIAAPTHAVPVAEEDGGGVPWLRALAFVLIAAGVGTGAGFAHHRLPDLRARLR